ncbi:MAG: hypothetical protein KA151_12685 [Piscinibacter sp.]|nr:hypothetical protein [Piscinibacter sp.]
MKFLLLAAVVLLVLWIARASRRRVGGRRAGADAPAAPPAQENMVACSRCGVHLPRSEALPGRGGLFCCEGHRAEHERADAAGH